MTRRVEVVPGEFHFVSFEAARIAEVADRVATAAGLADHHHLRIEVDETSGLGRVQLTGLDPVTVAALSGAFEDLRQPRQLSERSLEEVLGRLYHRARDRLDPSFGHPPREEDLSYPEVTAWDTYCVGRASRLGLRAAERRRRYHFRNRHGFTDAADAVFDRLWSAEGLTWADIEAACAETASAQAASGGTASGGKASGGKASGGKASAGSAAGSAAG